MSVFYEAKLIVNLNPVRVRIFNLNSSLIVFNLTRQKRTAILKCLFSGRFNLYNSTKLAIVVKYYWLSLCKATNPTY